MKSASKYSVLAYIAGAAFLMGLLAFAAKESNKSAEEIAAPSLITVETAAPVIDKISEWDEYTGRFQASNRVEVRARVSGFLEKVNFTDGEYVEKGQVLFVIDQRPFKNKLDQARANYLQVQSSLKTAQNNFSRIESLKETGALSTEEYETRKQALAYEEANLQLAQAKVNDAQLELEFTEVKAPISGMVSRDRLNQGNLVDGGSANSTLLTTIVATNPIHFYFTGSEADYLKYMRVAEGGENGSIRSAEVPIYIKLSDEQDFLHQATLDFVDNEIDRQSGTIEIRAVLQNNNQLLQPGMFGKAKLLRHSQHQVLMIPDEIIGTNQSLRYVYVLGPNNEVTSKNVIIGPLHSNGLRIIREGLSPEDKLIINNIQKIRSGMVVNPESSTINSANSSLASTK